MKGCMAYMTAWVAVVWHVVEIGVGVGAVGG